MESSDTILSTTEKTTYLFQKETLRHEGLAVCGPPGLKSLLQVIATLLSNFPLCYLNMLNVITKINLLTHPVQSCSLIDVGS